MDTLPDEETTQDDAPLSLSEAAKAFAASEAPQESDEDQSGPADAQEGDADDELPTDEEGEDDDNGDEDGDDDQADDEDDAGDEDPESEQGRFVADNARVKLPDGTFTTVAELKAGSLRNADYTQKTQAVAAKERELQSEREQTTQLKQHSEQLRDFTIAVMESFMPQPPDPKLFDEDPMAFFRAEREYKARKEQFDYLKAQKQWEGQQAQVTAQKEAKTKADTEWASLVKEMPELKDTERRNAVVTDLFKHGQEFGFDEQEIRSALTFDHRQVVVLSDAMKWRKLQASKAKTQAKVEGRPPIQKGGKRLNPNGMKRREAKVAMDRLSTSGSLKDGVRAFLASQKG